MAPETGAAAAQERWHVLVVGPDDQPLPLVISALRSIDPSAEIDRATTIAGAEQYLLSSDLYTVAFISESAFESEPELEPEAAVRRLQVGRRPPPLVRITGVSDTSPFAGLIPITVDASKTGPEQLLNSVRAADAVHRSSRLGHLMSTVVERLQADAGGHLVGLPALLDDLADILGVARARLVLTSHGSDLGWELVAGESTTPAHGPTQLIISRETSSYATELHIDPLPDHLDGLLRGAITSLLDLVIANVQIVSDRRSADRAATVSEVARLAIDTPRGPAGRPLDDAIRLALPHVSAQQLDALRHLDLELRHQPILSSIGEIVESDVRLALISATGNDDSTIDNGTMPDLSALDSFDAPDEVLVTRDLTVPIGHWLIATALPTLSRLQKSGNLADGHRIHISLLHRQLAHRTTSDLIIDLLDGHRIDPSSLVVDVAEPTLVEHHDTIAAMSRLAGHGVGLYLDGFGGAGSNFTLLRTSLVSGVRLSKQVIKGVSLDDRQASIVTGLITLCDELGLDVIATGVDHQPDLDWLTEFSNISLQGALVGPALTEEALLGERIN